MSWLRDLSVIASGLQNVFFGSGYVHSLNELSAPGLRLFGRVGIHRFHPSEGSLGPFEAIREKALALCGIAYWPMLVGVEF